MCHIGGVTTLLSHPDRLVLPGDGLVIAPQFCVGHGEGFQRFGAALESNRLFGQTQGARAISHTVLGA